MAVTIENPILNGPYDAPKRHFRFDEEGITSETVESRRCSAYYISRSRDDGRNLGGGSSDELNVQPSWIDFARARRNNPPFPHRYPGPFRRAPSSALAFFRRKHFHAADLMYFWCIRSRCLRVGRMSDYHINIFYSDEDGGYVADIPDLEACSAFGKTAEEALAEVEKARDAWLQAAKDAGKDIPPPRYRPVIYQVR